MRVPSTRSFSLLTRRMSVVFAPPAGPKNTVTALSGTSRVTSDSTVLPGYE